MITTSGGNVGGIAGYLYKSNNNNVFVRSTDIQNSVIQNNIIGYNNLNKFMGNNTDSGAGGIYGKIFSGRNGDEVNANSSMHRLEKTKVSGCWIYGPSAGGVLGHAQGTTICSNEAESETDISIEVKENKIYGICAGGAIGIYQNSAINYIGMSITDNRLQAYRNTANDSSFAGGDGTTTDGSAISKEGKEVAQNILDELVKLGLTNRGVKYKDSKYDADDIDADGRNATVYNHNEASDYYGVIRYSKRAGFPGIIVEHAFITNPDDVEKLKKDSFLKELGVADEIGRAHV